MNDAIQLTLFEQGRNHLVRGSRIDWSYSRRTAVDQCLRRYYYDYYGRRLKIADKEPRRQELSHLARLSNCYLRSGSIVHTAIRVFYSKGEDSRRWLVDWARSVYRQDYEYSRAAGRRSLNTVPGRTVMLLEFYYGWPDAESVFAESEQRLCTMIETFLKSSAYDVARFSGQRQSSTVEKPVVVDTPSFRARGKVDLAYHHDDGLTVVDWKTGETELPSRSLQLAFYGLWAVETLGQRADQVTLSYGRLSDGALVQTSLDEQGLDRGRARIMQDLDLMRALDAYGCDGIAAAFPKCGSLRVCKLCPYQEVCVSPGSEETASDD
jgi:hypothetical protein